MAIDTQSKRMSALLEGLVFPTGTIDAAARLAAAWLYNGGTLPAPSSGGGDTDNILVGYINNMGAGPTIGGM
jgi:hypothetical protein